jgi:hypothetical protein
MLQYKDYAAETAQNERTAMGKQGMKVVVSRDRVKPTSNYAKSTVNYTGRLVEGSELLVDPVPFNDRVIKNTFNPKSVKERLNAIKDIGPRTTISIPEPLKRAFNKRGREDSFTQLILNAQNPHSETPIT